MKRPAMCGFKSHPNPFLFSGASMWEWDQDWEDDLEDKDAETYEDE